MADLNSILEYYRKTLSANIDHNNENNRIRNFKELRDDVESHVVEKFKLPERKDKQHPDLSLGMHEIDNELKGKLN